MTISRDGKPLTHQSALITENPSARKKGFKAENLRVISPTPGDTEAASRLEARLMAGDERRLSSGDQAFIKRIWASYQRKFSNEIPEVEDSLLTDGVLHLDDGRVKVSMPRDSFDGNGRFVSTPETIFSESKSTLYYHNKPDLSIHESNYRRNRYTKRIRSGLFRKSLGRRSIGA